MTRQLVIMGVLIVLSASLVVGVMESNADGETDGSTDRLTQTPTSTPIVSPTVTPEPTPAPKPTATAARANRLDCEEIRGTDYLSREERRWFLANCVSN